MKSFSVKNGFGIGSAIFAVASVVAVILRTVQFFTVIEENQTGFYTESNWSVYTLYFVIAAAAIAFLVLGFSKRKKLDFDREIKKRPLFGAVSLVAGLGAFADGFACITKALSDLSPIIEQTYSGTAVWNTEKLIFYAQAIFASLSAIFFLALGISVTTGKTNGSEHKLISLSPVLWCIARMIFRFSRTISYLKVSDLTFELLMLVFCVLFFMAFAQVNSRIDDKNCEWKLAGYGLPAALLALICFIPRVIVTISGRSELLYEYSPVDFCDLTTAAFIIAAVFTRLTDRIDKPEEEEKEETPAEEIPVKE